MNNVIELAKSKGIEIEIDSHISKATEINILNGIEKSFEISNIGTYMIKAIKENRCVQFITETLENPKQIIETIENLFAIQENENENRLSTGESIHETKIRQENDYQKIKKDLISLEELKKKYPIKTIESSYGYYEEEQAIQNENANLKNDYYFQEFSIAVTFAEGEKSSIYYTFYYAKDYDFEGFKNYFMPKLENAFLKLNGTSCETKKYNVVLTNEVVSDLLSTFANMFFAKSIYLKESVLTGKFNQKVFSDKISIIEDPMSDAFTIQEYFDEEGSKTTYKELIKDGLFVKQMNNLEYAIKLNEEPTGNAGGYNNLYIKPGTCSYEDLISKLENGIIIDAIMGLHCGINPKTGDISIQAEGELVENGKITKGLKNIILNSSIFEILSNVVEVGNDFSKDKLDTFAPSLLLENITIAGEGEKDE